MLLNTMIHHANKSSRLLATSIGLSIAALGVFSSSTKAATYHLDFNALYIDGVAQSGTQFTNSRSNIDTEYAAYGINFSGINYRSDGRRSSDDQTATLRLFDTTSRSTSVGDDPDLWTGSDYGTTSQGNALIIQEWGKRNNAQEDDEADGGEITIDLTNADGSAKKVDFKGFTLIDVEPDEITDADGVNVWGFNDAGEKILDINIDALVKGFYDKYAGQYNASNHNNTNTVRDGVLASTDPNPSFSLDGVTVYQDGEQLGNNAVFDFKIDHDHENAHALSKITFQYADVSGAVSSISWKDHEPTPEPPPAPQSVPEPSALAGLVMVGAYGMRKYRQRKADKLAAAMGLGNEGGPKFS